MVEDDITIHPQNSLNSGYQGYTKPFYIYGAQVFGVDKAKDVAAHAREIKAAG